LSCNDHIFPSLFFLLQHNFFPLQLRLQTSATKLRYLRSSAFYRQPKILLSLKEISLQYSHNYNYRK